MIIRHGMREEGVWYSQTIDTDTLELSRIKWDGFGYYGERRAVTDELLMLARRERALLGLPPLT